MADILISVRGEAEQRTAPELAQVSASVATEGAEREDVVARASASAASMRERLDVLHGHGAVTAWSSGTTSVWSDRPWEPDGRAPELRHQATIAFTATFADVAALGEWVSTLADDATVRIAHVEWHLSPATRTRIERELATTAVGVAVSRASAYAAALGLGSVEPTEIADVGLLSGADAAPPESAFTRTALLAADGASGGIDLRPTEIVVSAAVEGRFIAR
ncbi:SIMPL domain-containing protein [Microbacterium thalli]|uniref:SIMPL domain-containing protein n=1 Tax=Microbacterium thalli TaxID=3027921 RepID=A0ABT5SII9_9MICO|nr:SIMPL domain-containing protein [Microbacterium thalli]MDD7962639.1 SIMPL domain-containing protein [Microbacterium thalli]